MDERVHYTYKFFRFFVPPSERILRIKKSKKLFLFYAVNYERIYAILVDILIKLILLPQKKKNFKTHEFIPLRMNRFHAIEVWKCSR